MNSIKINPDEMLANVKKIDKAVSNYEKHYKELIEVIASNEAQIDDATRTSLTASLNSINQRFNNMSTILKERNNIMQLVAESYKSVNGGGKAISVVAGVAGVKLPLIN